MKAARKSVFPSPSHPVGYGQAEKAFSAAAKRKHVWDVRGLWDIHRPKID